MTHNNTNNTMISCDDANGIENTKSAEITLISEDLCDASTVVNISLKKKEERLVEDEWKVVEEPLPVCQTSCSQKVVAWLNFSQFDITENTCNEDLDWWGTDSEANKDLPSLNFSYQNSFNAKRLRVFLLSVYPDLAEPQDLVSGLCHARCQAYIKFSDIHWLNNNTKDIPLCPRCLQADQEKELLLMFVVKLQVMDQTGTLKILNLYREKAEFFFCCSLIDYVKKKGVRENIVKQLQQMMVRKDKVVVPLMDVSVILINNYYFVHNTKIKFTKPSKKNANEISSC